MFFYKRSVRGILQWPLLNSDYHRLQDHNENRLHKDFSQIENKQTHCLHILAQQTLQTDAWSL